MMLVEQQGKQLHEHTEAEFRERLLRDTTTAFPFHIGFRDSLYIAHFVDSMWQANPMLMPLYYIPIEDDDALTMPDVPHVGFAGNSFDSASPLLDTRPLSLNTDTSNPHQYRLHGVGYGNDVNISSNQQTLCYISTYHPSLYKGIYQPDILIELKQQEIETTIPVTHIKSLVSDPQEDQLDRLRAIRWRYTYWYKEATTMLQLSQNYVTQNWYQGGNANFAVLSIVQGKLIYNNRKNITWENSLEWRFGFNTVSADTLRKINTNDDIFKLYSKFGVKIVNKLDGTISAEFQTHFFNTWKENTKELKTGPFTPARLNVSLGLDYKPVRGLSLLFSPLTYRMVGVADTTHVSQTAFSVPAGQKILNEAGSSFRVEWLFKPVREISLDTKFYLYTNYSRVEIDLEIAADFLITRFLSARILLHPRYDNTVILPDDERAKIQFKEFISVGFSHKFR